MAVFHAKLSMHRCPSEGSREPRTNPSSASAWITTSRWEWTDGETGVPLFCARLCVPCHAPSRKCATSVHAAPNDSLRLGSTMKTIFARSALPRHAGNSSSGALSNPIACSCMRLAGRCWTWIATNCPAPSSASWNRNHRWTENGQYSRNRGVARQLVAHGTDRHSPSPPP